MADFQSTILHDYCTSMNNSALNVFLFTRDVIKDNLLMFRQQCALVETSSSNEFSRTWWLKSKPSGWIFTRRHLHWLD